jgi:hypothetical protein
LAQPTQVRILLPPLKYGVSEAGLASPAGARAGRDGALDRVAVVACPVMAAVDHAGDRLNTQILIVVRGVPGHGRSWGVDVDAVVAVVVRGVAFEQRRRRSRVDANAVVELAVRPGRAFPSRPRSRLRANVRGNAQDRPVPVNPSKPPVAAASALPGGAPHRAKEHSFAGRQECRCQPEAEARVGGGLLPLCIESSSRFVSDEGSRLSPA